MFRVQTQAMFNFKALSVLNFFLIKFFNKDLKMTIQVLKNNF